MRAVEVANYLTERWGSDCPATIHKFNRLVYLVQSEAIATTGEPLFDDCIEAWQCGPVVPAVTHAFGEWGDTVIAEPIEHVEVKPDAVRLIDSVAEKYGPLSAFDLVSLVRRPGGAWARSYAPGREAEITLTQSRPRRTRARMQADLSPSRRHSMPLPGTCPGPSRCWRPHDEDLGRGERAGARPRRAGTRPRA